MTTTQKSTRLLETAEWASLLLLAIGIIAYAATSNEYVALAFLAPTAALRAFLLHKKRGTEQLLLLIGTLTVTFLTFIVSFG